jgi:aminomethyltransferase
MINISDQTGLIAVQGPKATACLQSLTDVKLGEIPYYHFVKGTVAGIDNVLISATGYTGAGGFELYVNNDQLPALWDAVLNIQHPVKPVPAGLGARDTLRLEMGYCLYGNDIDDTTSVLEAGLGWITKFKKNSEFPSKSYFETQKKEGLEKKLVGFIVDDRRVPRHGYPVCDEHGQDFGVVTSGTLSPTLQVPIGMAYVPVSHSKVGATFGVKAGSKILQARVVPIPFVKSTT